MSSTTRAPLAASSTTLPSITTPFVQPPDCKGQWETATVSSGRLHGRIVYDTVVVSLPAESCYPSGWEGVVSDIPLRFRPGVCPDGWTYQQMGEDTWSTATITHRSMGEDMQLDTTAFCCDRSVSFHSSFFDCGLPPGDAISINLLSSGYTYTSSIGSSTVGSDIWNWCSRGGWSIDTEARSGQITEFSTDLMTIHRAWAVTWAASDTATLTPKLPTITSSMLVPTWTPGETIPDGKWDKVYTSEGYRSGLDSLGNLGLFLVIGLPIFGALGIAGSIWCCVNAHRKRKREQVIIYVVNPSTAT